MDSELNKKKMRRYNFTFNLLIFAVVLAFFLLFFKVYNDYKTSQINDFIEYGFEQTKIVADEIENKLKNTLNEIHSNIGDLTPENIQRKHIQIETAHSEVESIFFAKDIVELRKFQTFQKESFQNELNELLELLPSEAMTILSDTLFSEGKFYLMALSHLSQKGYILSIVDFKNLVQNIMNPISFEIHRGAYILDEEADILYHYQPEMIGFNVFEDFQSESLKGVHRDMLASETGHGFYVLDWILEEDVFYDKITVWNSFTIGNRTFKAAKTADLAEMNKELTKLRNSGLILIILIFATLSVLALLNLKFQTRLLRTISNDLKCKLGKKTLEIKESEEKFKTYIENSQDLVIHIDDDFFIEYVSPSAKTILGYTPNEMIHKRLIHFIDRKTAVKIKSLKELKDLIYSKGFISPMIRKDSKIVSIEWSISSGNYASDQVYQLIGRDVTEKHKAENKFKKTAEFRRELLEFSAEKLDASPEKIPYQELLERILKYFEGNVKGSILVKCEDDRYRYTASHGYDQQILNRISFSEEELFDSNTTQPVIKKKIKRSQKVDSDTLKFLKNAGFDKPSAVMTVPIFMNNQLMARFSVDRFGAEEDFNDEDLDIASLFVQQIEVYLERQMHEKKLIEEKDKLYHLAMFDSLTKLPNRLNTETYYKKTCLERKSKKESVALVYINIKKFKDLNAIFGRILGDEILITIAKRLKKGLKGEEFAARFESDEFILIVPFDDKAKLISRIETINSRLKEAYNFSQTTIILNFKVGISIYPDDGNDFNTLFKNAGIAANQKDTIDEEIIFFKKMQVKKITERMFMEQQLRNAIENPINFQMVYQPCVRIDHKENNSAKTSINHLEALIRWTLEDGRQIPPGLFIPISEETGMIHKLGKIIARQIASQIVEFQQKGLNIPVSMNLSAKELMRKDIVQQLDNILRENKITGDQLGIEITESALIENLSNSVQKLKAFKQLGISISIDDFGTGYSSLSYINSFPIDYIKIDKSFVDRIASEDNSRSIVKTIISLTESLGAKTIAEGVETKEQLDILKDLGCTIIQGYYFYKPMPAHSVLDL
ncbi:MAG: EAL domain-containing protein [Thermotogota bacterium]|nr:EAL domain-containing protein [Thermotogota bacterium]